MASANGKKPNRRTFLKGTAAAVGAAGLGAGVWLGGGWHASRAMGKKVIIIGVDGMDPRLSESMMQEGLLPNLAKLRASGGFSELGTSIPPQSPVAWANFINGAGPGSHGIFDFVHRHPHEQCKPFYSAAETLPGEGGMEIGEYKIPLDFWPFSDKPPKTVLRRQGVPFWDYLDKAGIPSTFYDLPSNYPASPSKYGHHRCISGMGTPDLQGDYGTYQFFAENPFYSAASAVGLMASELAFEPIMAASALIADNEPKRRQGGIHNKLNFSGETAKARILGPQNSMLKKPEAVGIDFLVHRDRRANAAVIQIQGKRIVLKPGEWSRWTQLEFTLSAPWCMPNKTVTGICRFYLQEVEPNFRLYVTPININPADPAVPVSEPPSFIQDVAGRIGPFYTTGFQEDHKARSNDVFDDDEYLRQATMVLEERLKLLEYALKNYDDGLLFFYFSSSDLQSHMFWWTPGDEHPYRSESEAKRCNQHIRTLYQRLDAVIGELHQTHSNATIIVMSDHGFANFGMQFNLNSWLCNPGNYLNPRECTSIMEDVDWSQTRAYGLGINGLYLNLKGREKEGIVEPSDANALMTEIATRLEAVRDFNDRPVIRNVYRANKIYSGTATALAPDLIVGYHRGFRASWDTCLGSLSEEVFTKNDAAWSADHCADALEVPGVLWCNHAITGRNPSLVDLAPSILAAYGLPTPQGMDGHNVLEA
jgi:predicted AlkP superfamily phosphohydrolase/phosphomutase